MGWVGGRLCLPCPHCQHFGWRCERAIRCWVVCWRGSVGIPRVTAAGRRGVCAVCVLQHAQHRVKHGAAVLLRCGVFLCPGLLLCTWWCGHLVALCASCWPPPHNRGCSSHHEQTWVGSAFCQHRRRLASRFRTLLRLSCSIIHARAARARAGHGWPLLCHAVRRLQCLSCCLPCLV